LEHNIMCNADALHPSKITPHSNAKLDMVAPSAWTEWRSTRKRQRWHNLEDPFIDPVVQKHMTISTNRWQPHGFHSALSPIQPTLADTHGSMRTDAHDTDRTPKVRRMS
jgi:hypothetical protein